MLRAHLQIAVSVKRAPRGGPDHGVIAINRWYVPDVATKHALIRAGLGWGSMPRTAVAADLAAGRLAVLRPTRWEGADRLPPATLAAIHHRERPLGTAARAVIAALRAAQDGAPPLVLDSGEGRVAGGSEHRGGASTANGEPGLSHA